MQCTERQAVRREPAAFTRDLICHQLSCQQTETSTLIVCAALSHPAMLFEGLSINIQLELCYSSLLS